MPAAAAAEQRLPVWRRSTRIEPLLLPVRGRLCRCVVDRANVPDSEAVVGHSGGVGVEGARALASLQGVSRGPLLGRGV
jgi:hypothetical protein